MRETIFIHMGQPEGKASWCLRSRPIPDPTRRPTVEHGSLDEALAACGDRRIVLILPGAQVLLKQVDIPVRKTQRLYQAVPYALEEELAQDVDGLHFALGHRLADGQMPVAVIDRTVMNGYLDPFTQRELQPERVVCETLCLRRQSESEWTLLLTGQQAVVRTGDYRGFVCELSALEDFLAMMEKPEALRLRIYSDDSSGHGELLKRLAAGYDSYSPTELSHALEALYAGADDPANVDLLQDDYAVTTSYEQWWAPWRATAALALTFVLLATGVQAVEYVRLSMQQSALEAEAAQIFKATFPDATRLVNLRAQAQQRLQGMRQGSGGVGLFPLLEGTAQALGQTDGVNLEEVQLQGGKLSLSLESDNIQTLETLRANFAKVSQLKFNVESANAGSEGVSIRATVEPVGT